MRKLTRIGVLVLAVAGLLGSSTQPAAAAEVTGVVYAGEATVGPGIALPCVDEGTFSVADCPLLGTDVGAGFVVTGHYPFLTRPTLFIDDGDTAGFTFESEACAAAAATVDEGPHTLSAGPCIKLASGSVEGWCGLSQGFITGAWGINPALSVVPPGTGPSRGYTFVGGFTTVATVSVVGGSLRNTTSGENGMYTGLFTAVPQSPFDCLDNSSTKDFTVAGVGVAVLHDIPPH